MNFAVHEPRQVSEESKGHALTLITTLGIRVQELRQQVLHKENILGKYLLRIGDNDWMKSDLLDSISYIKTRLIQLEECKREVLLHVDSLGFFIACANGAGEVYHESMSPVIGVSLQNKTTYVFGKCQMTASDKKRILLACPSSSHNGRQSGSISEKYAAITGGTFYALGQGVLKEQ